MRAAPRAAAQVGWLSWSWRWVHEVGWALFRACCISSPHAELLSRQHASVHLCFPWKHTCGRWLARGRAPTLPPTHPPNERIGRNGRVKMPQPVHPYRPLQASWTATCCPTCSSTCSSTRRPTTRTAARSRCCTWWCCCSACSSGAADAAQRPACLPGDAPRLHWAVALLIVRSVHALLPGFAICIRACTSLSTPRHLPTLQPPTPAHLPRPACRGAVAFLAREAATSDYRLDAVHLAICLHHYGVLDTSAADAGGPACRRARACGLQGGAGRGARVLATCLRQQRLLPAATLPATLLPMLGSTSGPFTLWGHASALPRAAGCSQPALRPGAPTRHLGEFRPGVQARVGAAWTSGS